MVVFLRFMVRVNMVVAAMFACMIMHKLFGAATVGMRKGVFVLVPKRVS